MQGHRRQRETQRSSATSISPMGGGGTASIFLSLLLRDAHRHRVVVALATNVTIFMERGTYPRAMLKEVVNRTTPFDRCQLT